MNIFKKFVILTFNFYLHFINCTDRCCENCQTSSFVIEKEDDKNCDFCNQTDYVLSGEIIELNCRPCHNVVAKRRWTNITWTIEPFVNDSSTNFSINKVLIHDQFSSSALIQMNTTKSQVFYAVCEKQNFSIASSSEREQTMIDFIVCARLMRPILQCVCFPNGEISELAIVCNWTDANADILEHKNCIYDYSHAHYSLARTQAHWSYRKLDLFNNSGDVCLAEQICIINYTKSLGYCKINDAIVSTESAKLKINISAKLSSRSGHKKLQNEIYSYSIDLPSIYKQTERPSVQCLTDICIITVLRTPCIMENTSFEITLRILDIKLNKSSPWQSHITNVKFQDVTKWKCCIYHTLKNLIPNRHYAFIVKYKIVNGIYDTGPFHIFANTSSKAPNFSINIPSGGYFIENNQITLIWPDVPEILQNGPNFTYTVMLQNGTVVNVKNSNLNIQLSQRDILVNISCRNSIGLCSNYGLMQISQNFQAPSNVEVVKGHLGDSFSLQWISVKDANFYQIFWCQALDWKLCEKNLNFVNISSEFNEYNGSLSNIQDNFIFGLSACFSNGCSAITKAKIFENTFKSSWNDIKIDEKITDKGDIVLHFDNERFVSYYHVIMNISTNTFYDKYVEPREELHVTCESVNYAKVFTVRVKAFRKLGQQDYERPEFRKNLPTKCEPANLMPWISFAVLLLAFLAITVITVCILNWWLNKIVKSLLAEFEKLIQAEIQDSKFKLKLEDKIQIYRYDKQWFENHFMKSWSTCLVDLKTKGMSMFCFRPFLFEYANSVAHQTSRNVKPDRLDLCKSQLSDSKTSLQSETDEKHHSLQDGESTEENSVSSESEYEYDESEYESSSEEDSRVVERNNEGYCELRSSVLNRNNENAKKSSDSSSASPNVYLQALPNGMKKF